MEVGSTIIGMDAAAGERGRDDLPEQWTTFMMTGGWMEILYGRFSSALSRRGWRGNV